LHFGLVNHVVAHEDLIPFTRQIARDISGIDPRAVQHIRGTYRDINADEPAWAVESRDSKRWRSESYDASKVESSRQGIIDRGRNQ
jgi:enoyl-CoA hydratase